ncbi:MAG: ATP-binding protein [Kibdelosporangium sp.]
MSDQAQPAGDEIEVRVAADPAQLPVLRAIASVVAMRQDFDLDAIADLKMAVDEACSMLILHSVKDSILSCRFAPAKAEIRVLATAMSDSDVWPDTGSFGWHVLSTLTDTVDAGVAPASADPGGFTLRIELAKRSGPGHE